VIALHHQYRAMELGFLTKNESGILTIAIAGGVIVPLIQHLLAVHLVPS
jgi:fucose permease